jgi:hypothetical protein
MIRWATSQGENAVSSKLAIAGLIPALTLASASAIATTTVVKLDQPFSPTQSFYTGDAGPGASFSADFAATPKTATTTKGIFDYQFDYTVPASGAGNGSFSASFISSASGITSVSFDGHSYAYPAVNTTLTIEPFNIVARQPNMIEVIGNLGSARSLTFDGTTIFIAAPEPVTWAMVLVGFGFIGLALRSKILRKLRTA